MHQFSMFDIGQEPYKIDKPVRLIELFAGIGAQAKALERLGVPFEHYRICEFDKYAVQSYNAIHGTSFETSDITQIGAEDLGIVETDKYEYIMTFKADNKEVSNTVRSGGRGSLDKHSWDIIIEPSIVQRPHGYNKGGKKEICPSITTSAFQENNLVKVKEATKKGYGNKALNETLENNSIDDNDFIDAYNRNIRKDGIAGTITTRVNDSNNVFVAKKDKQIKIKNATKKGYLEAEDGDGIDISARMKYHRGTVQKQSAQTITTQANVGVLENTRIRKLTPLECWRLMDFDDIDFYKAKEAGISNSQLYKQAGNSIVVNVLEAIFRELFRRKNE